MNRPALAALVSFALLGGACTNDSPSAAPSASPSVSATSATPTASSSATASATPTATATATATPTASPTPPAPACAVVRGSRAVGDAQNSSVAFVDGSTGVVAVGRRIYRTTDGGAHWRPVRTLAGKAWDVVQAGCRTLFLISEGRGTRLDRSDDGGATWRSVSTSLPPFRALDFVTQRVGFALQANSDDIGGTIWKTNDGGVNWRPTNQPSTRVFSIAAAANGVTLAGVADGVALSLDGGSSWRHVLRSRFTNGTTRVWLGTNLRSGFALFEDPGPEGSDHALHRTENLTSWRQVASSADPRKLGVSPRVLGGYGSAGLMVGRFDPDGVSTSTTRNSGASFYRGMVIPQDEEGGDIVYGVSGIAWPLAARTVLVVGADQSAVYRSGDGGATWRHVTLLEG